MSFWDGTRWVHSDDLDRATALPSGAGTRQAPATLASRAGGWGATAVMLLVLAALIVPFTASNAGSTTPPTVSTSPDTGAAGSRVIVTGSNFPVGVALQLTWDGGIKGMPKALVATRGTFQTRMTIQLVNGGRCTRRDALRKKRAIERLPKTSAGDAKNLQQLLGRNHFELGISAVGGLLVRAPSP